MVSSHLFDSTYLVGLLRRRSQLLSPSPRMMGCKQTRLAIIWGSRVLRWRRWNTLRRLYSTSSWLTGTTKGLDKLMALQPSPSCHGMQADKPCDVSGFSNFAVAVEYSLVVILYILRVDRGDKGTGYAADYLTVPRVSGGL